MRARARSPRRLVDSAIARGWRGTAVGDTTWVAVSRYLSALARVLSRREEAGGLDVDAWRATLKVSIMNVMRSTRSPWACVPMPVLKAAKARARERPHAAP